jgi:hypothetical protein
MWLYNLPTTISTSMLCKGRNTPALRSRDCSYNVAAKQVHRTFAIVLLCEGCILSYVQNYCLPAFLQHACRLALLQYVSCSKPCNTTPGGLRTTLWNACKSCPSRIVRSHHVCCLPDTIPVCVSSSPVSTADCWKMHVMCQVTLQSSLSLFELSASRQSSVV